MVLIARIRSRCLSARGADGSIANMPGSTSRASDSPSPSFEVRMRVTRARAFSSEPNMTHRLRAQHQRSADESTNPPAPTGGRTRRPPVPLSRPAVAPFLQQQGRP